MTDETKNEKPEPKVGVTLRKGRKVVKKGTIKRSVAEKALVDAFPYDVSKAMLCFPTLKQGKTFKYRHGGYNVTLSPLAEHIDQY